MNQTRKVIKTGNSLAITIPSKAIKDFNIREGDIATFVTYPQSSAIKFTFTGHPRQLLLISRKQ
ncbi:MAG: AbrB/MazE/SpoVT family DNA-binding domain-containing protein [Candidatus Shapirobacteria bacterium]|jgi:antitoxin component of MazEF toxin-antitoxin module